MSNTFTDWVIGSTYTFNSIPSGVLPTKYTGIKLISISSYKAAVRIEGKGLYIQWRQIFPKLPANTPDAPEDAQWLVFETDDEELIVLANNWIAGGTVVATSFTQATVKVTKTNYNDMMVLRDFMTKCGMTFEINFQ